MTRISLTKLGIVVVSIALGSMTYILFLLVDFTYWLLGEEPPSNKKTREEKAVPWFELGEDEEATIEDTKLNFNAWQIGKVYKVLTPLLRSYWSWLV